MPQVEPIRSVGSSKQAKYRITVVQNDQPHLISLQFHDDSLSESFIEQLACDLMEATNVDDANAFKWDPDFDRYRQL